ncbi:MAG TPA: IS1182 family transposase [Acidimicrobiales bacterium]|nr:IS1182 family transposase [Acidimicrobiales bacterium]
MTAASDQLFALDDGEGEDDGQRPAIPAVAAGRQRTFRAYEPHQQFLLPPSIDDWLPEDHQARFIAEAVDELLDLEAVYASYVVAEGAPPYDPTMMLKLLLWGYSCGVTSSREMERRCGTDVAFRFLSANQAPDYRSIARFRRRHLSALDALFVQTLALCAEAGLVTLGRVALDGTKLRASASRHKAMSYDRLGPKIQEYEAQVRSLLEEAEAVDQAEDEALGESRRGDELPEGLARRQTRLEKLRAAKEAIEADARAKAAAKAAEKAKAAGKSDAEGQEAAERAAEKATPEGRAQRNFTDPESRMMKTTEGFHYAYNAQAVVDEEAQVVLAAHVTQAGGDLDQLFSMTDRMQENCVAAGIEDRPEVVLADAGYCSEDNLARAIDTETDMLIATGRLQHTERAPEAPRGPIPKNATHRQGMARRLRTKKGRADYARRKAIVEPAFGQMKVRQHAGFLRLRGLERAKGEWTLHALCHNLRKLANTRAVAPA